MNNAVGGLLASCILVASCGGSDADEGSNDARQETVAEPATTAPPATQPATTEPPATAAPTTEPPAEPDLLIEDDDGWIYGFVTPEPPTAEIIIDKFTQDSPPGKAELRIKVSTPQLAGIPLIPATEGRNPPERFTGLGEVGFVLESLPYAGIDDYPVGCSLGNLDSFEGAFDRLGLQCSTGIDNTEVDKTIWISGDEEAMDELKANLKAAPQFFEIRLLGCTLAWDPAPTLYGSC